MPRTKQTVLEYRTYDLPADFPILVLAGEEWRISPVPSKRLHIHNYLEIGLCHSDSGQMILGEEQQDFSADCVTFVARNVPHTTWSSPGTYSLWSYLYIDVEAVLGRYGLSQLPDLNAFNKMLANGHFILSRQNHPWALPLARGILDEFQEKKPGWRACVRGLLLTFVIDMLRIYSDEDERARDKDLTVITPALDYMRRNYDQAFSMERLAEMCHISPTHFRRLFGAQIGTNPLQFLHQLRITQSCRLLRTTEGTIAEIATQVGYSSLCCFNQHFRRIMGCTPSEWRRSGGEERPALITFTGWMQAETPEES